MITEIFLGPAAENASDRFAGPQIVACVARDSNGPHEARGCGPVLVVDGPKLEISIPFQWDIHGISSTHEIM